MKPPSVGHRRPRNRRKNTIVGLPPRVQRELWRTMLRDDLSAFVRKVFETLRPGEPYLHNWHIELLCAILAPQRQKRRLRKIINLPPRSLKSIIVSVALPAWLLGHDPSLQIIVVSYSDELARKLSRDFRTVVEAKWFRDLFPAMTLEKATETEITTKQQGCRFATSTGGTLTGRGGGIVILDDPIKPIDAESDITRSKNNEWFDGTLFARIDNKERDSIILVMQRLHQDDLSGHLVEKGAFDLIALPAIAIEDENWRLPGGRVVRRKVGEALHSARESLATLAEVKASQGSRVFQAQYQQTPVPAEGHLFRGSWIRRYDALLALERADIVQSWDTATAVGQKNDYSVCTTWAILANNYYLLDVHRGRWEFPELMKQVREMAARFSARTVLIEDANSGSGLLQSLRPNCSFNLIGRKPRLEKQVRAATQSACFEAGRVALPRDAPWLIEYESELLGFPLSKYDDQVDSTVQFLEWAEEKAASRTPMVAPIIVRLARPDWMVHFNGY
jgi:predicted phage terminase large subunit-like protein